LPHELEAEYPGTVEPKVAKKKLPFQIGTKDKETSNVYSDEDY
jgi:hypothetical protein